MNIIDKVRSYFQNFDPNNAFASMMATIASLSSENLLSVVYLLIAAGTFWHNLRNAKLRLDVELRKSEAEIKRIELELEKDIINNKKESLANDRFEIETNKLNITNEPTKN